MDGFSSNIILIFLLTTVTAKLHLVGNGYEGVVVTIDSEISEDPNLLTRLENILTNASAALFRATRNQIYFKEFIFVIPQAWPSKGTYEAALDVDLDKSDIIIDMPSQEHGNEPYTRQFRGCGKPGMYIHLTPDYVLDSKVAAQWGSPGKTMVHEWAHYRWGLFDEYPMDDEDKRFYQHNGYWHATRCSMEIRGDMEHQDKSKSCEFNIKLGKFDDACVFVPKPDSRNAVSSLLFAQYLDSVVEFCDNPNTAPKHLKHNRMALNRQNRLCNYQSAWEVMRKHEDFANLPDKPSLSDKLDTTPKFRYVQAKHRKRVLVLDTSSSMNGKYLSLLRQAATIYIMGIIETGSKMGIVGFSTLASNLSSMVEIKSKGDREALVQALPNSATGKTSIGSGLYLAWQMLTRDKDPKFPRSGSIILITDGKENNDPQIPSVQPKLIKEGIVVHSLAYGQQADNLIAHLSKATGGRIIYYSGNVNSTAHIDGLSSTVTSKNSMVASRDAPISILTEAHAVTADTTLNDTFYIDSTIGRKTSLSFTYNEPINVQIGRPDGTKLANPSTVNRANNVLMIALDDEIVPGPWSYQVTTDAPSSNVIVDIQSKPRQQGKEVFRIHSWISQKEDVMFSATTFLEVYAEVSQGKASVLGASVIATVERPDAETLYLPLMDNGIASDILKDDGIYSANIIAKDFAGNGRYNVKVRVTGSKTQTKVKKEGPRSASAALRRPGTGGTPVSLKNEPSENFQRVATAGEFRLQNFFENVIDELPPARITNFKSKLTDFDQQQAEFSWTAVGGDMDRGHASGYIIFISSDLDTILMNLTYAGHLSDKDIIRGNLNSSLAPGQVEEYMVSIPYLRVNETIYLSVVAVDETGNQGEPSNVVSLSRIEAKKLSDASPLNILALAISVGATCLTVIAFGILIYFLKFGKKSSKTND